MTDLVFSAGGMVDKYIGDALGRVRRAARPAGSRRPRLPHRPGDAAAAGRAERRVAGDGISCRHRRDRHQQRPDVRRQHGSARRKNYTVVGDAVNQASRLEGLTKEFGAPILVGERTRELAGARFVFREIDRVRLRGRDQAEAVYELLGEVPADPTGYEQALAAYRERRWDDAEAGLDALLRGRPGDGPARVLRDRVRRLRTTPPGDEWDGVYDQTGK